MAEISGFSLGASNFVEQAYLTVSSSLDFCSILCVLSNSNVVLKNHVKRYLALLIFAGFLQTSRGFLSTAIAVFWSKLFGAAFSLSNCSISCSFPSLFGSTYTKKGIVIYIFMMFCLSCKLIWWISQFCLSCNLDRQRLICLAPRASSLATSCYYSR